MNNKDGNIFSSLTGLGLVVIASCRLAYAMTLAGSLFWVFVLTALSLNLAAPLLPDRGRLSKGGRAVIVLFMAYFWGGLYVFFLQLLDPFLGADLYFLLMLVPLYYSSLDYRCGGDAGAALNAAETPLAGTAAAAAYPAAAALALALVREPLGWGTLTLPGGSGGIMPIFSFTPPLAVFSRSAGALIVLGYACALYHIFFVRGAKHE